MLHAIKKKHNLFFAAEGYVITKGHHSTVCSGQSKTYRIVHNRTVV